MIRVFAGRAAVLRLLAAAALLHVATTVALFTAGVTEIAPHLVDRHGIASASPDSMSYRAAAVRLADALTEGGVPAWIVTPAPLHVRLFSLTFVLFGPLVGYTILAAEPLNLLCYLAIVGLAYATARELCGDRVATVTGAIVALWPTFLVHTTQFLKDPLFIAGTLAFLFVVVTWLTMIYDWRRSLASAGVLVLCTALVLLIRPRFVVAVVAVIAFGIVLLVARQFVERRLLVWNAGAAVVSLTCAVLMLPHARTYQAVKAYPSTVRGEPKGAAIGVKLLPGLISWRPAATDDATRLQEAIDRGTLAAGSLRGRYNVSNAEGRSGIDDAVELRNASDVVRYLPRAAAIGLAAPFPSFWMHSGGRVGRTGRILSGAETFAIYCFELLALAAVLLAPRRIPTLLLVVSATFGVTLLALVVSNVGTLYRFRYPFWILFIIAGISGARKLARLLPRLRPRPLHHQGRAALLIALIGLASVSCARAAGSRTNAGHLAVTNATGWEIVGIYASPGGATTWEENLLGRTTLRDGDAVDIAFAPYPAATPWDLRVDGIGGYRAEWNDLPFAQLSTITLRIGKGVAIADLRPLTPRRGSR